MSSILFLPDHLRRGYGEPGYVRQYGSAGGRAGLPRPLVGPETNLLREDFPRALGYLGAGLAGNGQVLGHRGGEGGLLDPV